MKERTNQPTPTNPTPRTETNAGFSGANFKHHKIMKNDYQISHGGRDQYVEVKRKKDLVGDCAIRATALFLNLPYHQVRDDLFEIAKKRFNMPNNDAVVYEYLEQNGFNMHPTMYKNGRTKFTLGEFPVNKGRVMCRLNKHWATIIDGVVYDTWDCRQWAVGRYLVND